MKFRAFLIEMAESEIMAMIPTSEYMRIKLIDPKPLFKAYVVGHEGESRGSIAIAGQTIGNVVKKWYQSAIRKLHEKIDLGLNLFHGHDQTNAQDGRDSIGQVVGKALKEIQSRLSVVVAAWVKPEFRNLPLDVASIEANILLTDRDGSYEADVENVSGIALGSSQTETPGFAGATLLGQIWAFAEESQKVNFGGNENMTLEDIKKAIQEGKLKPSDLFDESNLFADPLIGERVKEHNRQGYETRKIEDLINERKKLEEKVKEQDEEIKKLEVETAKSQINTLFETMKEKRKLDEKEVKFIEKKLAKFEPKEANKIEDELNTYVDDLVDEFAEIRKDVFEEEAEDDNGGEKKDVEGEKKESITSPKKKDTGKEEEGNPLIP